MAHAPEIRVNENRHQLALAGIVHHAHLKAPVVTDRARREAKAAALARVDMGGDKIDVVKLHLFHPV